MSDPETPEGLRLLYDLLVKLKNGVPPATDDVKCTGMPTSVADMDSEIFTEGFGST